jgi:hypothetical protein
MPSIAFYRSCERPGREGGAGAGGAGAAGVAGGSDASPAFLLRRCRAGRRRGPPAPGGGPRWRGPRAWLQRPRPAGVACGSSANRLCARQRPGAPPGSAAAICGPRGAPAAGVAARAGGRCAARAGAARGAGRRRLLPRRAGRRRAPRCRCSAPLRPRPPRLTRPARPPPRADGKTFKKPRRPFEKERLDAELKLVGAGAPVAGLAGAGPAQQP